MADKKIVKCLYYAYPSSEMAKEQGLSESGCYYLFVGDEDLDPNTGAHVVAAAADKASVMARSYDYRLPWGNYSLHDK